MEDVSRGPQTCACAGNTYSTIKPWFVLDTVDGVHIPSQLVRLLVYDSSIRLIQGKAMKIEHTSLGDD